MELSNLSPINGSVNTKKKRIGRGQGSGKGGTSTRGHKGAKSRSGYSKKLGFEWTFVEINSLKAELREIKGLIKELVNGS